MFVRTYNISMWVYLHTFWVADDDMNGAQIGFIIWALVGVVIISLGIIDMFSKKPVGFWANVESVKVKDVKRYNRATGILFIVYGVVFVLLGIPLLEGQNSPYIIISIVGVMLETIIFMAVYSLVIEKKYGAKQQ